MNLRFLITDVADATPPPPTQDALFGPPRTTVDRYAAPRPAATATFSPCRTYRYALTRVWDPARPLVAFVMLNPSTADAFTEDATVRRCSAFARSWAGGLLVLNLFALRATDPRQLRTHPDPVGPDNDNVIAETFSVDGPIVGTVICAWGVHGTLHGRDQHVLDLLRGRCVRPLCLGTTKDSHPRHPLYVPGNTATREYGGRSA